jgi:hypothetical protein
MSCDWNAYCLDCESTLIFNDTNHMDMEVALLCKHASAIGALDPLMKAAPNNGSILFSLDPGGKIDTKWFAAHASHRLVPISEYGDFVDQCWEYVQCSGGSSKRCTLTPDHEGEHSLKVRT